MSYEKGMVTQIFTCKSTIFLVVLFLSLCSSHSIAEDNSQSKSNNFTKLWITNIRKAIGGLAVGDVDSDGKLEIMVTSCYSQEMDILDNSGNIIKTFKLKDYPVSSAGMDIIKLSDIDADGAPEILVAKASSSVISGYNHLGQRVWRLFSAGVSIGEFKVADLLGDGKKEVVISGLEGICVYSLDGKTHWRNNNLTHFWSFDIADIDKDGQKEIIGVSDGKIYILDKEGRMKKTYSPRGGVNELMIKDFMGGDDLEIICYGFPQGSKLRGEMFVVLDSKGKEIWYFERDMDFFKERTTTFTVSDFDRNGKKELLIGTVDGNIFIFDRQGRNIWEYFTGHGMPGIIDNVEVFDLDGDGSKDELIFDSWSSVYAINPHLSYNDVGGFFDLNH